MKRTDTVHVCVVFSDSPLGGLEFVCARGDILDTLVDAIHVLGDVLDVFPPIARIDISGVEA